MCTLQSLVWGQGRRPQQGTGTRSFPGPYVVSLGVGRTGEPSVLESLRFLYVHFWEPDMLQKERNEKQNPKASAPPTPPPALLPVFLPLSHSQEPSTSASSGAIWAGWNLESCEDMASGTSPLFLPVSVRGPELLRAEVTSQA